MQRKALQKVDVFCKSTLVTMPLQSAGSFGVELRKELNHQTRLSNKRTKRIFWMDKSLAKYTRVVITRLRRYSIQVKSVRGPAEDVYDIPSINFEFTPKFAPFTVNRRQYPLRLAYATTFNSCQGLTLQRVVLNLRTQCSPMASSTPPVPGFEVGGICKFYLETTSTRFIFTTR